MRGAKGTVVRGMRVRLLPALAAAGLCACAQGEARPADAGGAARVTAPADSLSTEDLRAWVDALGAERLGERVGEPSPYLTDYFGVQPLRPIRRDRVLEDLVPRFAAAKRQDEDALTLEFTDGPSVRFTFGGRLAVDGNSVDVQYARVEIRDSAGYPSEPAAFRSALTAAGVADAYLLPNPYFAAEQAVHALMRNATSIEDVPVVVDTAGFGAAPFAAILVGETQGETEGYDRVRELLESPAVDWIAIEMLDENLQSVLDQYLAAVAPAALENSRVPLLDYYASNWNTRGHEITADPAENPYFRLIERARALGKPVIALDTDPKYALFRYGELPLGAAVRDFVWASNVPLTGRGVVYGSASHFRSARRPNMLTFLQERFADIVLFGMGAGN